MTKKLFHFYFIIPPGFEDLAKNEFSQKWPLFFDGPFPELNKSFGGLEGEFSLEDGVLLNQVLKIPTRIILRFAEFKCRDLPKLFKKVKNLDWAPFLSGHLPQIKVSAHKSRLFHTQKIEETVIKAIKTYYKGSPPKKKYFEAAENLPPQMLFFRFSEDTCTLSIDTSGDPLYKRSYRPFTGMAPLRENLGAALCFSLEKNLKEDMHLVDPMCGSGTFLLEGKHWFSANQNRNFSYLSFPVIQKLTPQLKKAAPSKGLFKSFQGFEKDPKVLEGQKENGPFKVTAHDFLSEDKIEALPSETALLINPPYGKRIPLDNKPKVYYKNLFNKIKNKIGPKAFGILLPKDQLSFLKKTDPYVLTEKKSFKNGGIPVDFLIFCKPQS
jgi:putative N6-adenine-specific DNA methylase